MSRSMRIFAAAITIAAAGGLALGQASRGSGASPSAGRVSVYPEPGADAASTRTQISFRGIRPAAIGHVKVFGSRSGGHSGRLLAHSDGQGASFVPRRPFSNREQVSVRTDLTIRRGHRGDFTFRIGDFNTAAKAPAGGIPPEGDRDRRPLAFRSRPDLRIPRVRIITPAHGTAPGYLFLAPKLDGPMIADNAGTPIWFSSLGDARKGVGVADFRTQTYRGQPVLTFWKGPFHTGGYTFGTDVILDRNYRLLGRVRAGNGYHADLHEFRLTSRGTAYVTAYRHVRADLRKFGGVRNGTVLDSVAQEIDVQTGLVVWEWHSLDHVGMKESGLSSKLVKREPYDYFHINSIADDGAGRAIISARNTSAVYGVNKATGKVTWRLGGNRATFKQSGRGRTRTIGQHDALRHPDGTLTVFDNGFVKTPVRRASRVVVLQFDGRHVSTKGVYFYPRTKRYPGPMLSTSQGNAQVLPNGNLLIGWGSRPVITEHSPSGEVLFDATVKARNSSYRVYRFPWIGQPAEPPAIASSVAKGTVAAWASWNGDTRVRTWRLLGGPDPAHLTKLADSPRTGFETQLGGAATPWVAVAGLDADGKELGRSQTVRAGKGAYPR